MADNTGTVARTDGAIGGDLDSSIFRRLLQERIVFLGEEVGDENANTLCAQLLLLAAEDNERDIHLYINSPGGSVTAGMAIYDTMQLIGPDVATYAMGLAGSMAQVLLCAGAPGKRYALPHSRILMHQVSGGIGGTAADIAIQAEQMLFMKHQSFEVIAHHTGQPIERVIQDADRDKWFSAEQAREYGFIDKVISRIGQVADQQV